MYYQGYDNREQKIQKFSSRKYKCKTDKMSLVYFSCHMTTIDSLTVKHRSCH